MSHKWNSDNIPDQSGRVVVVTGSSSGIGYETARVLAAKSAEVIIAVRNLEKGNTAADKIINEFADANVRVMELDLASLKSVRSFAGSFKSGYNHLDLLINNAGVMMPPYSKTEDGFELQFGTNHLGHFALTGLLIDMIINTEGARIVNVSSMAHKRGNLDFSDLNWEIRNYDPMKSYADSKIANIYFTLELVRKIGSGDKSPMVTAAHPGWTATELQRHSGLFDKLNYFFAQDITMGALPTLMAAVDPDAKTGDYYGPKGFMEMRGYPKKVETNSLSQDQEIARRLWDISEESTGIKFEL